jgi:hypothetical protein
MGMNLLSSLILLTACGGSAATMGDDDDGPGPDAAPPANTGFVALSTYSGSSGGTAFQGGAASASFNTTPGAACAEEKFDNCSVFTCPQGQTTTPTYVSAGTLTVTGARESITMSPEPDNSYMAHVSMQTLFSGGEMLTFTGSGADAPGFTASIRAPSRISITSPTKPPTDGAVAVDRAQPFRVAWSGGGAGIVQVFVSPSSGGVLVSCRFEASAGSGSVPAAALGQLPAGAGVFSTSSIADATTDEADWRIFTQAIFSPVWPDQSIASASVTLQ